MQINPTQLQNLNPLRPAVRSQAEQMKAAEQLQQAYRDFVGTTFFGQMLKAMRNTVGKPAYFHGGQTEEVFRAQLDQHIADRLSESTAPQIADPMFRHQFPDQAALLADHRRGKADALSNLELLRRR